MIVLQNLLRFLFGSGHTLATVAAISSGNNIAVKRDCVKATEVSSPITHAHSIFEFKIGVVMGHAINTNRNSGKLFSRKLIVPVLLALSLLAPSGSIFAATGGGATIHNVATVSFGGNTDTDSENVTVETLATDPTITVDSTAQSVAQSANATYTYTFTNNANGTDTFAVASASTDAGVTGAPTLNLNGSGTANTSVTLGATISNAASDVAGNVYIPAGSETNLAATETVVVSGVGTYTINTITAGTPANTVAGVTTPEISTILTLTPVGAAPVITTGTVPTGTQIGEQTSFTLQLTASTVSVAGVDGTHTVNLTSTTTATDAAAAVVVTSTSAGNSNETITTVSAGVLTFTKEVRNVTKGTAFATTGMTLESGDVLEYRITATPTPGGGNITSSVLVDEVPTDTTYVAGSTTLNGSAVTDGAGSTLATTAANGGLSINTPSGAAGVLVDGESAVVLFQVLVD